MINKLLISAALSTLSVASASNVDLEQNNSQLTNYNSSFSNDRDSIKESRKAFLIAERTAQVEASFEGKQFFTYKDFGLTKEMDKKIHDMIQNNETWTLVARGDAPLELIDTKLPGDNTLGASYAKSHHLYIIKYILNRLYPDLDVEFKVDSLAWFPDNTLSTVNQYYGDPTNNTNAEGISDRDQWAINISVYENLDFVNDDGSNSSSCKDFNFSEFETEFGNDIHSHFNPIYEFGKYENRDNLLKAHDSIDYRNVCASKLFAERVSDDSSPLTYLNTNNLATTDWETGKKEIFGLEVGDESNLYTGDIQQFSPKTLLRFKVGNEEMSDTEYFGRATTFHILGAEAYANTILDTAENTGLSPDAKVIMHSSVEAMLNSWIGFYSMNDGIESLPGYTSDAINKMILGAGKSRNGIDFYDFEPSYWTTYPVLAISPQFMPDLLQYLHLDESWKGNVADIQAKPFKLINPTEEHPLKIYHNEPYSSLITPLVIPNIPNFHTQKVSNKPLLNEITHAIHEENSIKKSISSAVKNMSSLGFRELLVQASESEVDLISELESMGLLTITVSEKDQFYLNTNFYNEFISAANNILRTSGIITINDKGLTLNVVTEDEYARLNAGMIRVPTIMGTSIYDSMTDARKIDFISTDSKKRLIHADDVGELWSDDVILKFDVGIVASGSTLEEVIYQKGYGPEFHDFLFNKNMDYEEIKEESTKWGIHIYEDGLKLLNALSNKEVKTALVSGADVLGGALMAEYETIAEVGSFKRENYFMSVPNGLPDCSVSEYVEIKHSNIKAKCTTIVNESQKFIDERDIQIVIKGQDIDYASEKSHLLHSIMTKMVHATSTDELHSKLSLFTNSYQTHIIDRKAWRYKMLGVLIIIGFSSLLVIKPVITSISASHKNTILANYDELTKLYNRRHLQSRIREIESTRGDSLAIVYVDFDKFKMINDFYGHDTGDSMLKIISRKISRYCGTNIEAFRIGGDEFILIIKNMTRNEVKNFIQNLKKNVERPILFSSYNIKPEISFGIHYTIKYQGDSLTDAINAADSALYDSKANNGMSWYAEKSGQIIAFINKISADGIANEEVRPIFQPICASDRTVKGFEMLFRTNIKGINKNIPKFFNQLEKTGVSHIVDMAMFEKLITLIKGEWGDALKKSGSFVSINFTPQTLARYISEIEIRIRELKDIKFPVDRIVVEIVEDKADNDSLVEVIRKIKEMGLSTALDDFTAGSSSMVRLTKLNGLIDHIKVDREVIQSLDITVVKKTVDFTWWLASSIGCKSVVLEGVETADRVVGKKDTIYQGWYFSTHMTESDALNVLKNGRIKSNKNGKK